MSDTKEPNKQEDIKTNYQVLVEQLLLLAKEFNACDGVVKDIQEIKCAKSFKRAYVRSHTDCCEKFGIDVYEDSSDLEDEIDDLKNEIDVLNSQLEDAQTQFGRNNNMWDEYKIKHFLDYRGNYTEWELEELLKNGKLFLNSINIHKQEKSLIIMDKYILIGKVPKKVSNISEWSYWYGNNANNCVVKQDSQNGVRVSTVFLGLDHNFNPRSTGNREPILFETMIFGGKHNLYTERYSTWEQAEIGHKKALEMTKPNFIMRIINWFKKYNS